MKKESQVSPVMMEILVVTLFLALSASVLMQLIAKARDISVAATAESHALILAQDALESAKADPEGDGQFDETGARTFSREQDGVTLRCTVTKKSTPAGSYYTITADTLSGTTALISLSTARYVPLAEVTP